jgi:hypothetical protein
MTTKSSDSRHAEMFDSFIPSSIQRALLKSVFVNCELASAHCYTEFHPTQAKAVSGHYRRGKIEDDLAGIGGRFREEMKGKMDVSIRTFKRRTGHYNEVTCGNVKLTQSCIANADVVPRSALFRKTLAKNGQYHLFNQALNVEIDAADSYLYAILTYAIDVLSENRKFPAFVRVQFPNADCTAYIDKGIDLFGRFPEVVAEYMPSNEVQLVPRKRKAKAQGE